MSHTDMSANYCIISQYHVHKCTHWVAFTCRLVSCQLPIIVGGSDPPHFHSVDTGTIDLIDCTIDPVNFWHKRHHEATVS